MFQFYYYIVMYWFSRLLQPRGWELPVSWSLSILRNSTNLCLHVSRAIYLLLIFAPIFISSLWFFFSFFLPTFLTFHCGLIPMAAKIVWEILRIEVLTCAKREGLFFNFLIFILMIPNYRVSYALYDLTPCRKYIISNNANVYFDFTAPFLEKP